MKPSISIKAIAASQTWELRHKVMWPGESIEYVKLPKDTTGEHYGLFKDEGLIAVVSLFIEGNNAQFRKFATATTEQGKGYGTKLLTYLFEKIKDYPVKQIWCNARKDKSLFYEKFGMKVTKECYVKGEHEFVIMTKEI